MGALSPSLLRLRERFFLLPEQFTNHGDHIIFPIPGGDSTSQFQKNSDRYFYGMHSFALEQIGDWNRAKSLAEEGLKRSDGLPDPWLLHGLIHVAHKGGDWDQGIAFLEKYTEISLSCLQ